MNALEQLLVDARKRGGSSAEVDDVKHRAYCRRVRAGLWHAAEGLQIDRMNEDGSWPETDSTEPAHEQ